MCKFFVDIKTGKLDILSHSDEHKLGRLKYKVKCIHIKTSKINNSKRWKAKSFEYRCIREKSSPLRWLFTSKLGRIGWNKWAKLTKMETYPIGMFHKENMSSINLIQTKGFSLLVKCHRTPCFFRYSGIQRTSPSISWNSRFTNPLYAHWNFSVYTLLILPPIQ